jgi:hypothetical protein
MSRRRKYRHSRTVIAKIRDTMKQIRMLIERAGSYRAKTSGRIITRLGNPQGAEHLRGRGNREAVAALRQNADEFAMKLAPIIDGIRAEWTGRKPPTLRELAVELSLRDVPTYRGVVWEWKHVMVSRILKRIARIRGE